MIIDFHNHFYPPEYLDAADNFVAGDHGVFDVRQFAIDDVQVGPANAAGAHTHADLSVIRKRIGALLRLQRRTRRRQNHRVHLCVSGNRCPQALRKV